MYSGRCSTCNNVDFWDEHDEGVLVTYMSSATQQDKPESNCERVIAPESWDIVLKSSEFSAHDVHWYGSSAILSFLTSSYLQSHSYTVHAEDVTAVLAICFWYFHVRNPEIQEAYTLSNLANTAATCTISQFLSNFSDSSGNRRYSDIKFWIQFTATV